MARGVAMMPPNRHDLIVAIEALSKSTLVTGHYVTSDDGEPYDGEDFCLEHAGIVAWWVALEQPGIDVWVGSTDCGSDGHRFCAFGGCNLHLDFGGLTTNGIDSALGLTEKEPLACSVYPSELDLAGASMVGDDPRWEMWTKQALRLLKNERAPRRAARAA